MYICIYIYVYFLKRSIILIIRCICDGYVFYYRFIILGLYDYLYVFIPMKKFLFGVNVCVFVTMMLFYV